MTAIHVYICVKINRHPDLIRRIMRNTFQKLAIFGLVSISFLMARSMARHTLPTEVLSNRARFVKQHTHTIFNNTDHVLPVHALSDHTLQDQTINPCEPSLLRSKCDPGVPQFVTFAVVNLDDWSLGHFARRFIQSVTFGIIRFERWSVGDLENGLKLMYSSLVRAHNCEVVLHVYCDSPTLMRALKHLTTTMGTSSNITAYFLSTDSIRDNAYTDPWLRLSRHKLNIMSRHVRSGTRVVWIDVDTLVFTDLREAFELSSTWVIGWMHGNRNRDKYVKISGVPIPPVFETQGDLWSIDSDAIEEVLALEKSLKVKPEYDLQGYFSILLTRNSSRFRLLTDVIKNYTFGFQCSNYEHPTTSNFQPIVVNNQLHCRDRQNLGTSTRVGSISSTAPTFKKMFLAENGDIFQMSQVSNNVARSWLKNYFYCRK